MKLWPKHPLAPPEKDVKLGWKSQYTYLCNPSRVSRLKQKSLFFKIQPDSKRRHFIHHPLSNLPIGLLGIFFQTT